MRKEKQVFLLASRGLGDSVVLADTIHFVEKSNPFLKLVIAGKAANLCVLRELGIQAEYIEIPFPASTGKNVNLSSSLKLLETLSRIRGRGIEVGINPIPDFREDLAFRLVSCTNTYRGNFSKSEAVTKQCRGFKIVEYGRSVELAPDDIYSMYRQLFCYALGISYNGKLNSRYISVSPIQRILVCPFSGHTSREWPINEWLILCSLLKQRDLDVSIIFPQGKSEENQSRTLAFAQLGISVYVPKLEEFVGLIKEFQLVICHDSFAAHLANYFKISTIVVSGSGDYRTWVPSSNVITNGHNCPTFPCHSRPKCMGSAHELTCINSIKPETVASAVDKIVTYSYGSQQNS
jgi:heptosyltransferase-3